MDVADLEYLLQPAGRELLAEVEASYDGTNALPVSQRLRRSHGGDHVAAALTQTELRRKAVTKLGPRAAAMYFT
ncbi:MAG: SAM-dependent methyltransferase, partial [Nocardioidaceae bacterium]